MPNWRDELIEAVKTKAEREAEEQERHRKRVQEALSSAEAAVALAIEALRFTCDKLVEKKLEANLGEQPDSYKLVLRDLSLGVTLDRESAVVRVTFLDAKPREFDFAKDRHIAPADVEEYVGRRAVELVRTAHKANPW